MPSCVFVPGTLRLYSLLSWAVPAEGWAREGSVATFTHVAEGRIRVPAGCRLASLLDPGLSLGCGKEGEGPRSARGKPQSCTSLPWR